MSRRWCGCGVRSTVEIRALFYTYFIHHSLLFPHSALFTIALVSLYTVLEKLHTERILTNQRVDKTLHSFSRYYLRYLTRADKISRHASAYRQCVQLSAVYTFSSFLPSLSSLYQIINAWNLVSTWQFHWRSLLSLNIYGQYFASLTKMRWKPYASYSRHNTQKTNTRNSLM